MIRRWIALGVVTVGLAGVLNCNWVNAHPQTVNNVLRAADFTCILLSEFATSSEVMTACHIEESARPFVEQLLVSKTGLQNAGALKPAAGSHLDAGWGY